MNPRTFAKDAGTLTRFLKAMLWILVGATVLSFASDMLQMQLLSSGSFNTTEAEANDTRQRVAGIIYLLAYAVTGVAFLKWIHRANLNVRGFGAQNLQFTPGWSIGYYFIPFLNWVRPYRAMKEIWQARILTSGAISLFRRFLVGGGHYSSSLVSWAKCLSA